MKEKQTAALFCREGRDFVWEVIRLWPDPVFLN